MRPATSGHREVPGRQTYSAIALIYGLFVIYGSLVPFEFQRLPLGQAFESFSTIFVLPLRVDSRMDVVTNILLFIPLAYCLLAALSTDRRGRIGRLAAALS